MSTAVSPHNGPSIIVPARFQGRPPAETLGDGISTGFPVIRIRGSKWWISTGKDEEHRIPLEAIDVVILRAPAFASRAYYKGYKGDRSKGERPLCSSLQGKRPDPGVPEPQSELCDLCPRNKTYTNDKGMQVRDCSNGKRLAVLPWFWTKDVLGKPLLRPCLLRVPGASLQALKAYGDTLARSGVPYYALLTRISFEQKKEYPKMIFAYNNEVQMDDDSAVIIDQMRESSDALFITGENAGSMREIEGTEEPAPAPKPKPTAVSLAQWDAASKTDEETDEVKEVEAEIILPEKKAKPKKEKVYATPVTVKAEVDTVDAGDETDDALKSEVLKLLG